MSAASFDVSNVSDVSSVSGVSGAHRTSEPAPYRDEDFPGCERRAAFRRSGCWCRGSRRCARRGPGSGVVQCLLGIVLAPRP